MEQVPHETPGHRHLAGFRPVDFVCRTPTTMFGF